MYANENLMVMLNLGRDQYEERLQEAEARRRAARFTPARESWWDRLQLHLADWLIAAGQRMKRTHGHSHPASA